MPVDVTGAEGERTTRSSKDEGIRMPPSLERMAALKPAFGEGGTATAGNASQISDGAAALLLTSDRRRPSSGCGRGPACGRRRSWDLTRC